MESNINTPPNTDEPLLLAQRHLEQLGIRGAFVSQHGAIVRIQVPEIDFDRAIQMRETIVERMKALGYRYVALDLEDNLQA